MHPIEQKKFIETIQNSIDFLREQYLMCKKQSFGLWNPQNPSTRVPHWKTAILWWNHKPFKPVQKLVPKTVEMLKHGPCHKATGWMELDANSTVPKHNHIDWGEKYILQVPIVIPKGDIGFCIDDHQIYHWKAHELFVFDARKNHTAYNNTEKSRVILAMDFDSSWRETLEPYMK